MRRALPLRGAPEWLIQAVRAILGRIGRRGVTQIRAARLPLARLRWSYRLGAARSKSASNRGRQLNPSTRQRAFYHARLHFRPLWTAQGGGH